MRHHTTSIIALSGFVLAFWGASAAMAGPPTASERVETIVSAAEARGHKTPTLKQIMREPRWVSRPAEGAYWADDGHSVLFRRDRAEGVLSDQYRLTLDGVNPVGEAEIVPDADLPLLSARGGDVSLDRQWKLSARGGDLFLKNLTTGVEQPLTRTKAGEYSPAFIRGGAAIVFSRGGTLVVRDMLSGEEQDVADLRTEDQPKDPPEPKKEKKGMAADQERLFAIVREREGDAEARRNRRKELDEADTTGVPGPFYLGKKQDVRQQELSEDGGWLLVTLSKSQENGKRDVMAAYVNADGYVDTRQVRANVGVDPLDSESVRLIDLGSEKVYEVDLGELPTIREDPLGWLKDQRKAEEDAKKGEEKKKEQNAEGAEGAEKTEAKTEAEAADEPSAGASDDQPSTPESEKQDADKKEPEKKGDKLARPAKPAEPRPVGVMRAAWSPTGPVCALMIRSSDNKDRWVVAVDVSSGEPEMKLVEHQRDEAWINWSYNEMGWLNDGRLWFTSEKSGYSRLYVWSGGGEPEMITGDGEFTVSNVSMSPDGAFLYYRANRTDPGEYEVERVNTATGMVEAVTGLGGSVDSYDLSPSGDRVLLTFSTAIDPPELYATNADGSGEPVRLTQTDEAEFRGFDWVKPEFVWVPSTHTAQPIHARLYEDPDAPSRNPGKPKPVVVFVHGAGYLQDAYNGWSYYWREHSMHTLLARAGYVVIAPDFRASAGYGRDWRTAVYRHMGGPELEDLDDCLAWLKAERGADTSKVGIYGGSYGGFLSLMAMFDRPGVYAAGAALRPVTDWTHYNDGYTANILNTPEIDPEAYRVSSPIEKAEGLQGRLLICHGMLDDNVVFQDSVRLTQRLIELEKENWTLAAFPVESHGFEEPTGWLNEYRRIFRMFEEELGGE